MRIDGRAISWADTQRVNEHINDAHNNIHQIVTYSPSVFLELTYGPDSVELMVGGDIVHVHDRKGATPVYLCDEDTRRETDIAYGPLYKVVSELSHLPRIVNDDLHMIKQALQFAAAESELRGHNEQAKEFRRVFLTL